MSSRDWKVATIAIALGLAFASSSALSTAMTVWDWLENPGGIFRSEDGTNWTFVWDTFFSWFWPTLVWLLPASVLLVLIGRRLRRSEPRD